MKRSFLEQFEIEKDVIDKIMAENGRDIEAAKGELENIKAELDSAKDTIKERDKQLTGLQKQAEGNAELTKQIEQLQAENKAATEKHNAEMNDLKISSAIDRALTAAKAKTPKAVRGMLDMAGIKIDKDGNISGIDEQVKTLTEGEDTKYLFDNGTGNDNTGGGFKGLTPKGGADPQNQNVSNGAKFAQIYSSQFSRSEN